MKKLNWQILLGIGLIALSAGIYFFHYLTFHDLHHIFIYLVGDIAFVPIEVLLVTLIIHRLLHQREKKILLKKMNMVIGVFFSEVGTTLLSDLTQLIAHQEELSQKLCLNGSWSKRQFLAMEKDLRKYAYTINIQHDKLAQLTEFFRERKEFILRLLQNPNLLEHDSFTDLLWSVTHLAEELLSRQDVYSLPQTDYEHLRGDIKRVYSRLIGEWVSYMLHLKESYPYLFSLAIRTNPFDPNRSICVK